MTKLENIVSNLAQISTKTTSFKIVDLSDLKYPNTSRDVAICRHDNQFSNIEIPRPNIELYFIELYFKHEIEIQEY